MGLTVAALAAAAFEVAALGALAPEFKSTFGLSRVQIGLLPSLVFGGGILSSRWAGRLTDAKGAPPVLGVALTSCAAGLVAAAASPTAAVFMLSVFVVGVGLGAVNPPTSALIAGRLAWRQGLFMSVKQSGVPLGGLLAGAVLPSVAVAFGWRISLAIPVAACLAVAAATRLVRHADVLESSAGNEIRPRSRQRESLSIALFGFIMGGSQWTIVVYLTLYLTDARGMSLYVAGIALALTQAAGVAGRLSWGWLSDLRRRTDVLVITSAIGFVSLLALASGVGGRLVWLAAAGAGFSIVGWNGAYFALVADRAGPGRIGKASGDAATFVFAGNITVPPLLALLADSIGGWRPLWALDAVIVAIAGIAIWFGARTLTIPDSGRGDS